jgi:hypothetical protein
MLLPSTSRGWPTNSADWWSGGVADRGLQPIDANLVMTQTDSVKDPLTGAAPRNRTNMQRMCV